MEDVKLLDGQDMLARPRSRKCHDILFVVIFLAFSVGMAYISATAYIHGDPTRYIQSLEKQLANQSWVDQLPQLQYVEANFKLQLVGLADDWHIVLCAALGSVAGAFLWLELMKLFTRVFVYLSLAGAILALAGSGVWLLMLSQFKCMIKFSGPGVCSVPDLALSPDLNKFVIACSYILIVIAAILLLVTIMSIRKIALTTDVMAEACRGLQRNGGILAVCVIFLLAYAAFHAYWWSSIVYLNSVIFDHHESSLLPSQLPAFQYLNSHTQYLFMYMVFGYYWYSSLLPGLFRCATAGALADWYFARRTRSNGNSWFGPAGVPFVSGSAFVSLARTLTLNLGSVLLGSLVLAIATFINWLLGVIRKRLAKASRLVNMLCCFLQVCVTCCMCIIKFFNRYAYTYIGIHGGSFCHACRESTALLVRNAATVAVLNTVGGFVILCGTILGAVVVTTLTFFICWWSHIDYQYLTVAVVAVLSLVCFHLFGTLVHTATDTVFLCYLHELDQKAAFVSLSENLHHQIQNMAQRSQSYDAETPAYVRPSGAHMHFMPTN